MTPDPSCTDPNRQARLIAIQTASQEAVREALRRHMLLGESVIVAGDDGRIRTLSPDEIRQIVAAA
jgi:hypothetical protein